MRPLLTSELARNGHPSNHEYKAIAVLRAYFDETGVHDGSGAVMVCGLVAPCNAWDAFDLDWCTQLDVPKVSHFHAVECQHAKGEFASLSDGIKSSLIWGLADVIGKHRPHMVNAGLKREDWDKGKFPNITNAFKNPYHVCFAHCLGQISKWSEQYADNEPVALVFADQREYKNYAQEIYEAYVECKGVDNNLISLQFAAAKHFPGLQAADLFCYEQYLHFRDGIVDPDLVQRVGMKRLLAANLPQMKSRFDAEFWGQLKLFCDARISQSGQ